MKRKLIQESLIYCILPIIAIAVFYNQYSSIPWLILTVVMYMMLVTIFKKIFVAKYGELL